VAKSPIGTLTKKIQRQPRVEVSTPPRTSPETDPMTIATWLTPNAQPRWFGGKASVRIAALLEKRRAAPIAWTIRKPTRAQALGANPQSNEPTVKRTKPRL